MALLIEGGLAEEPRAALGCAGGKGHRLQHCSENDKDNSQDRQHKHNLGKADPERGLALVTKANTQQQHREEQKSPTQTLHSAARGQRFRRAVAGAEALFILHIGGNDYTLRTSITLAAQGRNI